MKFWWKTLLGVALAVTLTLPVRAQQQSPIGVSIIHVNTTGGSIGGISVTDGGSGYTTATVTISGDGAGATATANITAGVITSITVDSPGSGYTFASVSITGDGVDALATATVVLTGAPNEQSGPAGTPVYIEAQGVGTSMVSSFTYSFYVNGVHIGTSTDPVLPPDTFTIRWTPPAPGAYFITAKIDDGTSTATSLPVRYFAIGVVVNSPVDGTLVPEGSSVVLKADATGAQGFIDKVEFYDGATLLGTDSTYPYSFIYTPQTGGAHAITAKSYDNLGNVATSVVVTLQTVPAIGTKPTSVISSPENGSVIAVPSASSPLAVTVDANSTSGFINKVELYVDGVLFGTKTIYPYTFDWTPQVVGFYNLVALTYDDKNNVVASSPASVRIAAPPSVTVSAPLADSTVAGGTPVQLSAVATDPGGNAIASVQFFVDSEFVGIVTSPSSGMTYTLTTTLEQKTNSDGSPKPSVITALATNTAGLSTVSSGVSVNVTSGGSGGGTVIGIAPTVSVTTPSAGAQLAVNVPHTLAANAIDADGNIVSVQFFVNGASVGTDSVYPYTLSWTPDSLGVYAVTATATDNDGNAVTGAAVAVTVMDPSSTPPAVAVTSPVDGASLSVNAPQTLIASATDADGYVAGVQFYVNGVAQGALVTAYPFATSWLPASPGTYAIKAVAFDNVGNQTTSATNTITVTAAPPAAASVAISTPAAAATLPVNVAQTITATAAVPGGSITAVRFYANGTLIGEPVTTYPYSVSWTPVTLGTYALTAVATDNNGLQTTSDPVSVTVDAGTAPTVALTSPTDGATLAIGAIYNVEASANGGTASVLNVQFFANGVPLEAPDLVYPFSAAWTPNAPGAYVLTAVVTTSAGVQVTSTPVNVTVGSNQAPSVSITAPSSPATAGVGTPVTITASATDSDGTIAGVQFFADGTSLGSVSAAPYALNWTPRIAGTYNVTAVATDNLGLATTSAAVVVNVSGGNAPAVTVTPLTPSVPNGVTQILAAEATAVTGTIASVQFFANGVSVGTDTTYPYNASWTPFALGNYALTALATDTAGNQTLSSPVNVTVTANQSPTVSITAPVAPATSGVGEAVTVTASAADADGTVVSVQFYVDGQALGAADTSAPFTTTWTPRQAGTYALTAVATDNVGAQTTSAAVNVTVAGGNAPTVAITSPTAATSVVVNTTQTITADASAAGLANIVSVQFYVNGNPLGSPDTTYPYAAAWTPGALGTYALTARATDSSGNQALSSAINVTVSAAPTGTVLLTPASATSVPLGSSMLLSATASGGQGAIKQIQFYDNGVAIGTPDLSAPYTLIYMPAGPVGATHAITARATDASGTLLPLSAGVTVTVIDAVEPLPTVEIISPQESAKIPVPDYTANPDDKVDVTVDARATVGFISKVELYVEGQLYETKSAYPYTFAWTPSVLGTYHLTALAYDNVGNVVASSASTSPSSTPTPRTVIIAAPPSVAITAPANFGPVTGGAISQVTVTATSSNGYPVTVQLFADDKYVGETLINSGGATGTIAYTAVQKKQLDENGNLVLVRTPLKAVATDPLGFTATSAIIQVNVTEGGGGTGSTTFGQPPTVTITSPVGGSTFPVNAPLQLKASASDSDGNITSVVFKVNSATIVANLTAYPYVTNWTPLNLGQYFITATVTDNDGNTVVSTPVTISVVDPSPDAPSVAVIEPAATSTLIAGTATNLIASASDDGRIASVQFYIDGQPFGSPITASPYQLAWTPATAGIYTLAARAADDVGNQTTSASVTVTVNANQAPTVTLTAPTAGTSVVAGKALTLSANAQDVDGTVTAVKFLANGIPIGAPVTTAPYTTTWTPSAAGTYNIVAQAVDDSNNLTTSAAVAVTVIGQQAPTVALTSPSAGTIVRLGSALTLNANAGDADGVVTSVKFNVGGTTVATVTSAPFSGTWTPSAGGVYRLTAVATDDSGLTTTSAEVVVAVIDPAQGDVDTVYTGIYQGAGESGVFAFIAAGGKTGTFIARSSGNAIYYYPELTISNGTFSEGTNGATIAGNVSDTAASGTFNEGKLTFIGTTAAGSASAVPAGLYAGSLSGRPASVLSAIVAADGSLALYLADGADADVGVLRTGTFPSGALGSDGSFTVGTAKGATVTGKIDPASGFLTATVTGGALAGNATGAASSGGALSDGSLRNLSTRGPVGAGDKVLIAGFVVNGDTPKQVLIRAIGPGLSTTFGMAGTLANPRLGIFQGATQVAQNDDWGTPVGGGASADAIKAASTLVGAFELEDGSQDAVVLATLAPGVYTAQVSSADSTTGVALVEVYDVDNHTPFSPQKVVNISTRGEVGTGSGVLIAGFVIDGSASKKVLIRANGPGLTLVGVGADMALADPKLTLYRATTVNGAQVSTVVRENDDWETGNSAALVAAATASSGAFAVESGSKDAAILITLPPGHYTAQVSGTGGTTGLALVEVYEIP